LILGYQFSYLEKHLEKSLQLSKHLEKSLQLSKRYIKTLQTDVQNELDTVEKWQHILQTVNVKFV